MASEFEHPSPDMKAVVVRVNDDYATLITKLTEGMSGIANDINAFVFVDKDGNAHKTLQDSTGLTPIPANSILITDSNGKATYNTNFKFDATGALIQFPLPFTLAFGDQNTNGSMRIAVTTAGIAFGKRISGVWSEVNLIA